MQKFPKVLRFYRKKDKSYYTFWGHKFTWGLLPEYTLQGVLSEEQQYMAEKIRENDNWVIHMGTGRGKSWVIYNAICEKRVRTLVLCHNIQTADTMYEGIIKNTNIPENTVGLVHSKSKHPRTGIIDVMTHASFVKNYKSLIDTYWMICYDECDYNLSFPERYDYDCMVGALIALSPKYLYGFTWTPYRAEGGVEVLNKIFGDVRTYCDDYNYTPNITQILYKYTGMYDFETFGQLMQSLNNLESRKQKQIELYKQKKRKRNLILTKSVNESNMIHSLIPWSIILTGELKWKELNESMDLISKSIDGNTGFTIVWTIDKIGRGVDIPPIDTLFLFSPVRFRWTVVQAVGRALRKYPGKTDVMIYDWCDMPILVKQQKERLKDYQKEYKLTKNDFNFINL